MSCMGACLALTLREDIASLRRKDTAPYLDTKMASCISRVDPATSVHMLSGQKVDCCAWRKECEMNRETQ